MIAFICMIIAVIVFVLAAWSKVSTNLNLVALGLAFMAASFALQTYPG